MNMVSLGSRSFQGRPVTAGRSGTIAALDVGSSKISCFIAKIEPGRLANGHAPVRVIGIGHQVSRGIRAGAVVDMDAAEEAIRVAVDAAERMAGVTIRDVVVGFSGAEPKSQTVGVRASITGGEVSDQDVSRLIHHAQTNFQPEGRDVMHAIPTNYSVDGSRGVRDPRGMVCETLAARLHVVDASVGTLRNLAACFARCDLEIESLVAASFASGLATLVDDERELGVTVVDMGGGTTSLAVFADGHLQHTDVIPVGGHHVTNDVARGLSTTIAHAERMKTLHGSTGAAPEDDRELLPVPLVGEDDHAIAKVPRSMLVGIIRPRLEETFELVRARLEDAGLGRLAGRRVVLTGGASQLIGVRELAAHVLDKQVRLGRPPVLRGLPDSVAGPAFAGPVGLLIWAATEGQIARDLAPVGHAGPPGPVRRLFTWLRERL